MLRAAMVAAIAALVMPVCVAAATKSLTIWPDQFVPANPASAEKLTRLDEILSSVDANPVQAMAPVSLPAGAVLKSLSAIVRITGPTTTVNVELLRMGYDVQEAEQVAYNYWYGSTGVFMENGGVVLPAPAKVLKGKRYWVRASISDSAGALKGVRITYTVP